MAKLKHLMRVSLAQVFAIDRRTLAMFRMVLALVLLSDLINRARHIAPFYSDQGVLPRFAQTQIYSSLPWLFSLHLLSGLVALQVLLFALALGCALALLVGYRTWWATFFSWVLLVSLHNRNPMVVQGGDVLLRLLLFWSLFLPLGARFSLDRSGDVSGPNTPKDQADGASTDTRSQFFETNVLSTGTVAILLQMCFVYWFTVALKSDPSWRSEGSALYYALSIDQMVKPLGSALLAFPSLLRLLTFATMALEFFGPFLVLLPFWRLRLAMVGVFIGFHLIMGLCLALGIFPWVTTVGWLLFVPGQAWDALEKRLATSPSTYVVKAKKTSCAVAQKLQNLLLYRELKSHTISSPNSKPKPWKIWLGQGLPVFFLFYVFCWNLRIVDRPTYVHILPKEWNWIGWLTRTDQSWGMFAPFPLKQDGWYIAVARLRDGRQVDLLRGGNPVDWNKPEHLSSTYEDALWRKYQMSLWDVSNAVHRRYYALYLIRRWNVEHSAQPISSLQLVFMREDTLPDYRTAQPRKVVIWQKNFRVDKRATNVDALGESRNVHRPVSNVRTGT